MRLKYFLLTLIISLLLISLFTFLPFAIHAADHPGLVTCGLMNGANVCNICDLITLFQTLVSQANVYFALPLAALMLGYGGFLMVLSGFQGGNAGLFKKGKTVLTNAIIGIVIIFCSWIAIDTLLKTIGAYQHAPSSKFGPWHVIECVSPVVKYPKHFACKDDDTCGEVDGYSIAGCTEARNCGANAEHLGCKDSTCQWIKEKGTNNCIEGDDPRCAHKGCDGTSCKFMPGTGPNECDTIGDNDPKCVHGTTTETERNLASALELEGLVEFSNLNPDCNGKSAATNYEEMLNSRPLTVCHANCKADKLPCTQQGFTAKPEMMENLVTLAEDGVSFGVNSVATGEHRPGSDHYKGKGIDLSTEQSNYANLERRFIKLKDEGSPIKSMQCEAKGTGAVVPCNSGNVGHLHISYN